MKREINIEQVITTRKVSFKEWLENNPNHKYAEATITRYIRALEKCEEWLHIELPKKILDIESPDEFENTEKTIKSHPDYLEVNRNHGHGDLSAALRK